MTQIMLGSALQQVAGPLADFAKKLSGPDGNTRWLPAFKRFLRGENPWDGKPLYTVWKTIVIGQRGNATEMIDDLREEGIGFSINLWGAFLKAEYSQAEYEVDLVLTTVKELGFPDGAAHPVILRRVIELGLEPCTLEMIGEARLDYLNPHDPEEMLDFIMYPLEFQVGDRKWNTTLHLRTDDESGDLYIGENDYRDHPPGGVQVICVLPRN